MINEHDAAAAGQSYRMSMAARACEVPEHLIGRLVRYIVNGIPPGSCLTAILANDLMEAFGRADETTAAGMKQIASFIYSYAPHECHGNYKIVNDWCASRSESV